MKLSISEILKRADAEPTKEGKIKILREEFVKPLGEVLIAAYDARVKWLLPKGEVPYKPNILPDQEGMLYQQTRTFYLYVSINDQPQSTITQVKREVSFIQLLECLDKNDAELLVHVKDGKLPYKSLTPELIYEAYPGLMVPKTPLKAEASVPEVKAPAPVKRGRGRPRKSDVQNQKSA